jgi:replication-associated recombination protein RarA
MGVATYIPPDLTPLCNRVKTIFSLFSAQPSTLQHLLLYGPPGTGKTTTVEWLLNAIWGESHMKQQTCRIMNASDERSLDSIRSKIIPFVQTDWRVPGDTRPRFLVLDECETLTESAQLALRPFLDKDPQDICIIFICNSLSRIQLSLRSRCLRIRFDPPPSSTLQTAIIRGDLRGPRYERSDIAQLLHFIHTGDSTYTFFELVQAALFFCTTMRIMDRELITKLRKYFHLNIELLNASLLEKERSFIRTTLLKKFEEIWFGSAAKVPKCQ